MPTFQHLHHHVKNHREGKKTLYLMAIMSFFWCIYDGIISFITPIAITEKGISESTMGFIIAFSSFAGILFDLLLCRVLKNTNYRRLYLLLFLSCCLYPFILYKASTPLFFLLPMAMWGLYYDLYNVSNFDFIESTVPRKEFTASFGVLRVFHGLGYLLAPILAGLIIGETLNFQPFLLAWIFLGIAFSFFMMLLFVSKKKSPLVEDKDKLPRKTTFLREFYLWKKIGHFILPVLCLTMMLNIIDSFFWTLGPIISESLFPEGKLGSLFMTAYSLPPLLVGWIIGSITHKYGQKKTAFISLLLGSLLFIPFPLIKNPVILISITFFASCFIAMAWPAINGAYTDYIFETPEVEKEIETLQDSFTNLGYILGPMVAGLLGQFVGNPGTIQILGITGALMAFLLLKITPRKINIILNN